MNQTSLFGKSGEVLRDQGMKRAIDHAEQVVPNWADLATAKLIEYIKIHPHLEFMGEDVRVWAHQRGLLEPPHKRAWGGVIMIAAKKGLIVRVRIGQVKNPNAHRANASVWRKS